MGRFRAPLWRGDRSDLAADVLLVLRRTHSTNTQPVVYLHGLNWAATHELHAPDDDTTTEHTGHHIIAGVSIAASEQPRSALLCYKRCA